MKFIYVHFHKTRIIPGSIGNVTHVPHGYFYHVSGRSPKIGTSVEELGIFHQIHEKGMYFYAKIYGQNIWWWRKIVHKKVGWIQKLFLYLFHKFNNIMGTPTTDDGIKKTETQVTDEKPTIKWYLEGVQFDTPEEFCALAKYNEEFSSPAGLKFYCDEQAAHNDPNFWTTEQFMEVWNKTPKMSASDILKNYHSNAQRLMAVFCIVPPNEILNELGGQVISTETIKKTQPRIVVKGAQEGSTNGKDAVYATLKSQAAKDGYLPEDLFEKVEVTFEDTYILHKLDKKKIEGVALDDDIYVIECQCPSTDKHYFLFVDAREPQCQTALGAIAWTMRGVDGQPLSVEEYKDLLYKEA